MLYDLAHDGIKIPTGVFSKTKLCKNQIKYLKEIGYPYLVQVTSEEWLKNILNKIFTQEFIPELISSIFEENEKVG